MRKKPMIWNAIHGLSIGAFLLFAIGAILSFQHLLNPPQQTSASETPIQETPPPALETKPILLGLGDSLTRGIGDEKGLGYIGLLRNQWQKEQKQSLQLTNLAISGQTSKQLLSQLQQKQVQQLLSQAEIITMTIGGNDVRQAIDDQGRLNEQKAKALRKTYETNLHNILKHIRQHNDHTPVYLFALYNPYGNLSEATQTNREVTQWNEVIQQVANHYVDVVIIPTFDLFQLSPSQYLSSDHFHPNHQGYNRMAERLYPVLTHTK